MTDTGNIKASALKTIRAHPGNEKFQNIVFNSVLMVIVLPIAHSS